jgi:hypothetical protein
MKYDNYKDMKPIAAALKCLYGGDRGRSVEADITQNHVGREIPAAIKSREQLGYSVQLFRISAGDTEDHIHDEHHRVAAQAIRKVTKTKAVFPTMTVCEMLYFASKLLSKKRTQRYRNGMVLTIWPCF